MLLIGQNKFQNFGLENSCACLPANHSCHPRSSRHKYLTPCRVPPLPSSPPLAYQRPSSFSPFVTFAFSVRLNAYITDYLFLARGSPLPCLLSSTPAATYSLTCVLDRLFAWCNSPLVCDYFAFRISERLTRGVFHLLDNSL